MMEQKSTSNLDHVRQIKAEIRAIEIKKQQLQKQLKSIQQTCDHEFHETAILRKCRKCKWTESVYY
ncbi:hypothetical protein DS745_12300 [Anaerobacillus alkaliphilus]|uniref:Serine protease n=1 Tax=Anaerobacillus alkaliphilus TaxID=1548597 RepID=A0A4Q0VSL7_9BACI|nr:hypothetical protein [Anaerobacillus alkaliphilus]RXJ00307.1 hypothetical protein DS745_12300 [Anaerobacillus alkaliphilus]